MVLNPCSYSISRMSMSRTTSLLAKSVSIFLVLVAMKNPLKFVPSTVDSPLSIAMFLRVSIKRYLVRLLAMPFLLCRFPNQPRFPSCPSSRCARRGEGESCSGGLVLSRWSLALGARPHRFRRVGSSRLPVAAILLRCWASLAFPFSFTPAVSRGPDFSSPLTGGLKEHSLHAYYIVDTSEVHWKTMGK